MNIINQIELDLTFTSQAEAVKLNAEWSPYLEPVLEEVIESFCNQFNNTNEVIFIDELIIDLGSLNSPNISQKLVQFKTLLNEKLSQQISGILIDKENSLIDKNCS